MRSNTLQAALKSFILKLISVRIFFGHSNRNKKRKIEMVGTCGEDKRGKGGIEVTSEHSRRK